MGSTSVLAQPSGAPLFFSEYVEGSSFNKAVEIYNPTDETIDLLSGDYRVDSYVNGATVASRLIFLDGEIGPFGTFVIAHPSADQAILNVADQISGSVSHNGDDVIALSIGGSESGTVLDVIGKIDDEPRTEWGSDDVTTKEHTLRRNAEVCSGDTDGTDAFDPAGEWAGFAQNTFDGLGEHASDCQFIEVTGGNVDELINAIQLANTRPGLDTIELGDFYNYEFNEPFGGGSGGMTASGEGAEPNIIRIPVHGSTVYAINLNVVEDNGAPPGYGGFIGGTGNLIAAGTFPVCDGGCQLGASVASDSSQEPFFSFEMRLGGAMWTLDSYFHNSSPFATVYIPSGEVLNLSYGANNVDGGAIYNEGVLTLIESVVTDSYSDDDGGGIYNDEHGTLTVTNSTISGNDADEDGGGIYNDGYGDLTVTNSTISGNDAGEDGGAFTMITNLMRGSRIPPSAIISRGMVATL
jgi:hypothetical protein